MITILGWATVGNAQTILYEENIGTPTTNTLIENYTGWQNSSVIYVGNGTCDVRKSSASTGYAGASGNGNVMINDTVKWFQISGLNTTATLPTVKLYCGLRKTSTENGSNFVVEYSTDSLVWVRLPMSDTLPTGTGTGKWYRVCFPNVPAHPHLHLRFSNRHNVDYRLDDIRIVDGDEVINDDDTTDTNNVVDSDTSSLVTLPFDLTGNSDSTHADIKYMPGFRSNKLGTSYANGSAKFESKNAGSATLIAHLDSSPGTLSFDLKGMKSGTPSSYNGITFLVSESADGIQWTTVVSLNESDISSEEFSHFEEIPLAASTRYIRWLLASATNGNTQLNDIIITRQPVDTSDDSGIDDHGSDVPAPYPNPASTFFRWNLCEDAQMVQLYNESGALIRQWNNVPNGDDLDISGISPGLYILQAKTNVGKATKKLIIK